MGTLLQLEGHGRNDAGGDRPRRGDRPFGSRDENLRLFRDVLGLKVIAEWQSFSPRGSRSGRIRAEDPGSVAGKVSPPAGHFLFGCTHPHRTNATNDRIHSDRAAQNAPAEIVGPIVRLRTKTPGQRRYVEAMRNNDLVFCVGPAGTGKTFLAVAQALEEMHQRRIKRIVLVRPAVEAGEKLGFLPGDMQAKVNPYLRPLLDALRDMLDFEKVKAFMDNDAIEMAPLAFMRGRTLNESFIILDEGQNTTISQMQMFLTRMGAGSKIVVTGDITQVDLPPGTRSGLKDAVVRLDKLANVAVIRMEKTDIVRHALVQAIVKAYERPISHGEDWDNRSDHVDRMSDESKESGE